MNLLIHVEALTVVSLICLDAVQQLDIVGGARKLHSLAIAVHNKVSSFTAEQFISIYHHYLIWSGQPMVRAATSNV